MESNNQIDLNGVIVPRMAKTILPTLKLEPNTVPIDQNIMVNENIIGNDDRFRIERVMQYPYYTIGFLLAKFKNPNNPTQLDVKKGTAVLVSSRVILTCAHNFVEKRNGGKIEATEI